MRLKLLVCLLLFVSGLGFGQTPFTATYNLVGPGNDVTSFSYNGTTYPGIDPQDLLKVGITSTSSANNYRGSNWPTEALDSNKYIQFGINAVPGYRFTITSIQFGIGRSGTGTRQAEWRGNHNGFSNAINNYTTLNADLTNEAGVLTNPDTNSNWTGNVLNVETLYTDVNAAEFRLYLYNAESNAGTAGLAGNLTINGTFEPIIVGPTITVTPASITGLDYIFGNGPSAEQTFTISGSNLTNNILLTTPANFEISTTSGGGFGSNITLAQTGGSVPNTTIYTRLIGGLTNGNYAGNITAASTGATAQNVTVSGTVIANVVITEIMYDTTEADDEWIEICNFSGSPQDVSNYIVRVNSGFHTFTFPSNVIIPNNGCITVSLGSDGGGIFNNGDGTENDTGCPFVPDYGIPAGVNPADTNNLPNSTGPHTIELYASNGTSLADSVSYSGDDASAVNTSMHVIDPFLDNSSTTSNWAQVGNGGSPGTFSLISPCAVPNLIVKGDIASFPTIPSDGLNEPSPLNNTLYAAQTIGNSQAKTFRIANEGTLPLTITSITIGGANQDDFTITQMPSFNLAAGTFGILEITFSPLAAGQRNATVTVASNDPDTPSYVFNIRGTGICAITSASISPTAGVAGTNVTLTGENFGSLTTVNFRGIAVTPTIISATQLTFEIPSGVGSGVVTFTNDIGCQGQVNLEVITNTISACEGTAGTTPTELFISKVTDATVGGLVYIEIFNGTGSVINLGGYSVQFFNNGSSTQNGGNINLNAIDLNPGNVYVLRVGTVVNCVDAPGADGSLANQSFGSGGVNFGPGTDDHIRLYNGPTHIDSWGAFENNNWSANLGIGGSGVIFSRIGTASLLPNTTFNLLDWNYLNWNDCSDTDYSSIGSYDFSEGAAPTVSTPVLNSTNCLEATISVSATEGFVDGNPITYQWFVLAPGATTWVELTVDNAVYSGVTTNTLTINNTFNLNNYQYYCEVRENTATCSQASDAVRIEIEQTIWNGTAWSNGMPDASTSVIIEGNYDTSIGGLQVSFSACNLIINSGVVNIADGDFIEVYNNVFIESTAALPRLRVQPQGAFVQVNDDGTVTGNARIVKRTAPMNNWLEYTYWSAPVNNAIVNNALADAATNWRFWFNAQNYRDSYRENNNDGVFEAGQDDIDDDGNDWTLANGTAVMVPGRGYAAPLSPIAFVFGPGSQYLFNFDGVMNNGIITTPVYRNDNELNDNNWNFIGNPYPSAINADLFLAANASLVNTSVGSVNGAIFLWSQNTAPSNTNNGNEGINFAQADYAVINLSGETAGGDGVQPDRFIPSGQGFFVAMNNSATATNIGDNIWEANITFSNAMRVTGNNNLFFRNNSGSQPDKLWLNLTSDNGVFNQILVAYVQGATNHDDGMQYDAPRNLATGTFASLYSTIENNEKHFAIQGKNPISLSPDEVIALGFSTSIEVATLYRISIAQLQGDFMTNQTIYLKDKLKNIIHNLSENDYTFTSQVGDFKQRFDIVFNRDESLSIGEALVTPKSLSIVELSNGEVQFSVAENHQIKSIEIIDLLGRTIYRLHGNSNVEIYNLSQLSSAAYVAKVTLSNGQIINKKAIKRL